MIVTSRVSVCAMEKLFLRLQRPVPGFDHLAAIDPERLAELHSVWDEIAPVLDLDRINDFYVYEGEYGKDRRKWFRAAKGLGAVRSVLEYLRAGRSALNEDQTRAAIALFEIVENILDEADLRGIAFCFTGDY